MHLVPATVSAASLACTCLTEATVLSLRLKSELNRLLPPYIDLGFDQRVIAASGEHVSVSMGDMQTIEFISQYGRPMYVNLACKPRLLIPLPGGVHIYLKTNRAR